MHDADEQLDRLRDALDELAAADAPDVIFGARAEARARVRSLLADALAESLMGQVREQLQPAGRPEPEASPVPQERRAWPEPEAPASYVYGVVGTEEIPGRNLPPGVGEQTPGAIREGELTAVVSEVPMEDFGETQLRAHLADMEWVERIARGHEAVLDELRSAGTVIPMRMCTVYRDEEGVREMLRAESESFREALAHLKGRTEWGVKVFADPAATKPPGGPGPEERSERAGAAYMQRRRRERDERERAAQAIEQAAAEIHESLAAAAADALVTAPQRPEVTGHSGEMVLNGVYLVDDEAQDAFHARVRELQSQFRELALELQVTGPWPAYNFVPGAIGAAW